MGFDAEIYIFDVQRYQEQIAPATATMIASTLIPQLAHVSRLNPKQEISY